jgi:hypothetical protein
MADFVYNRGKFMLGQGRVTSSAVVQIMLVTTCYEDLANTIDNDFVDDGTTVDPKSYELSVGGYARSTLQGLTLVEDDTLEWAFFDATDETFSSLAAGETVGGAVAYIYSTTGGTTSDTGMELLSFFDLTNTPCNGGDISVQWASTTSGGFLRLGTTS